VRTSPPFTGNLTFDRCGMLPTHRWAVCAFTNRLLSCEFLSPCVYEVCPNKLETIVINHWLWALRSWCDPLQLGASPDPGKR
jgi:hypothetical protein